MSGSVEEYFRSLLYRVSSSDGAEEAWRIKRKQMVERTEKISIYKGMEGGGRDMKETM